MHADIKGALAQIKTSWRAFEHKGLKLTRLDVKRVLEYGLQKGYVSTSQISDDEVESVLKDVPIIASEIKRQIGKRVRITVRTNYTFYTTIEDVVRKNICVHGDWYHFSQVKKIELLEL